MNELVLNPNLLIQPILIDGRVTAYSLVALVKGRGRLNNTVKTLDADQDVIDVLDALIEAEVEVEVEESACAVLASLGVLVKPSEISKPVKFSCYLDSDVDMVTAPLTVNPDVAIIAFADFAASEKEVAFVLEPCAQIALVADPVTGARYPYWLDDRKCALLRRLVAGVSPPADLERAEVCQLAYAGVLIDQYAVALARQRLRVAADQFARRGYAELPLMLPPLQISALCSYYKTLLDEGHVADHDRQVALRFARHNEPLMQYFHRQLCGLFAQVAGRPIKPSYGYFASYRHGAILKKHVDREQCKFTASLLLDYAAPPDDQAWPLYLELPTSEDVGIRLEPGGCVLYRGCELPHYRDPFQGQHSTSFFLHYVDEEFSGQLH